MAAASSMAGGGVISGAKRRYISSANGYAAAAKALAAAAAAAWRRRQNIGRENKEISSCASENGNENKRNMARRRTQNIMQPQYRLFNGYSMKIGSMHLKINVA
jgi:hypothetical protein